MIGETLLNRYQIEAELGKGAMGRVYRAQDALLNRPVAVKVLSAVDLESNGKTRLLVEARAAARLNHPNIVSVYDAGEADGLPFIVMELVKGETLKHRRPQNLAEAVAIARQICAALDHAHRNNIIHRDLKPDNIIFVSPAQAEPAESDSVATRIKLMDFGLARAMDASQITGSGGLVGTFGYLAPEVIQGNPANQQSDLYALGVMIYELTTSQLPFAGRTVNETLSLHLHAAPTPPNSLTVDIPDWLDDLILRLLSKRPQDRPASAGAVLQQLTNSPLRAAPDLDRPHNLPALLSSFIGRAAEIASLRQRLMENRLVTLTGPGGIGKTRLAIQAGERLLPDYVDGIWLIELAPLADAGLAAQAVASGLGIQTGPERSLMAALIDYLEPKILLLILDNCEHIVDACAALVQTLLEACPQLRVLTTSRETLGISGEFVFRVPALSVPAAPDVALAELTESEAVQLFVARATAALPQFAITRVNAPAVAQVCRRLDGVALALELAAARVGMLKVEQIAIRLDDAFRLLAGGSRTALPRHQSLRATIDWSYQLLSEEERFVLRCLSVFAGGWSLSAAEAVCVPGRGDESRRATLISQRPNRVFEVLSQLVNKSLAVMEREQSEEARYWLLETIRQFTREKLGESGEAEAARGRQLRFFLDFAETAGASIHGPEQLRWLARLEAEHDNLRAALDWASESGRAAEALRLAAALYYFWFSRSHHLEGRERLRAALALPQAKGHLTEYAAALNAAGYLEWVCGRFAEAEILLKEAQTIASQNADRRNLAVALRTLGAVTCALGDYGRARAYLHESLNLFTRLQTDFEVGWTLFFLGDVDQYEFGLLEAPIFYEKALTLLRRAGDQNLIAYPIRQLAYWATRRGDYKRALRYCRDSLRMNMKIKEHRAIAACLAAFGGVYLATGDLARAVGCFGTAGAIMETLATQLLYADQVLYTRNLEAARAALNDADFAEAWERGRALSLEQAVANVLVEDE